MITRILLTCFVGCAIACGKTKDSASDSSSARDNPAAVVPRVSTADSVAVKPKCPHTGKWALCNVEQRLKQSGFVAKRDSSIQKKRSGFSVTPVAYKIGKESRLEVFIYPDARSLTQDVAKLDTVRVVPIGGTPAWNGNPTFIRSANLLAVFIADNPRQIERISLALTAGPPQPDSPR